MTVRFSFNTFARSPWYGQNSDVLAMIAAVGAAGFDAIGLDMLSLGAALEQGIAPETLAQALHEAGLDCPIIGACAMLDGTATPLHGLTQAAELASLLGASFLQVNVAAPDRPARCAAVAAAADAIAGKNLRLALEYLPFSGLADLAETLDIVAKVGAERAGALVDIWHHSHDANGWATLQSAPLDAIAYVEFDDALPALGKDLMMETMDRRTFPGEGVLETARFADLLLARGYSGLVSVEVLSRAHLDWPLDQFARRCLATAKPFWHTDT